MSLVDVRSSAGTYPSPHPQHPFCTPYASHVPIRFMHASVFPYRQNRVTGEPFFLGSSAVDVGPALICSVLPPDAQRSPSLTANFPSNNPFRNRATSPASHQSLPSPQLATFNFPDTAPQRPTSRNPFLDQNSQAASDASAPQDSMPLTNSTPTGNTAEIFVRPCLSFNQYLILLWAEHAGAEQSHIDGKVRGQWASSTDRSVFIYLSALAPGECTSWYPASAWTASTPSFEIRGRTTTLENRC